MLLLQAPHSLDRVRRRHLGGECRRRERAVSGEARPGGGHDAAAPPGRCKVIGPFAENCPAAGIRRSRGVAARVPGCLIFRTPPALPAALDKTPSAPVYIG
jgi:hypothetical protein